MQSMATPVIPNQYLEPAQQVIDAEYIEVDLPSKFVFYDFKHLYIKTFKMYNIRKLIQGQANSNPRYMTEVINSCIKCEKPVKDLAYQLTQEDLQYLLYWERLHSMPTMPYIHTIECTNPEHIKQVEEGKLSPKSLFFQQTIAQSTLHTDYLDPEKDYTLDQSKYISEQLKQQYPTLTVHYPLMKDYLDMLELAEQEVGSDDDGEVWFVTGIPTTYISVKDANGQELSIKQKYELLDSIDPESFYQLKQVEADFPKYGVNETVTGTCPRCGAVIKSEVILTAQSFLPSYNNARDIK